jgi:hypothetical protein
MQVTPEQTEFAEKLKAFPGEVQRMTPERISSYLRDAPAFRNCYFLFWTDGPEKYLIAFRYDRRPLDDEILPFLQLLFGDGQIHETGNTAYSREFSQGAYTETTIANKIADSLADAADKDSNSDAFDFDKTETGKRMLRRLKNGNA